jgi:acyl-CoA reductase-like NAD-dependent aldehyde dehydrogenase
MTTVSAALDANQPTGLFIDGAFVGAEDTLEVTNPYSGEVIAEVASGSTDDIARAVEIARRQIPIAPQAERAAILERAAGILRERSEAFARTIALESGKPISQARAEASRCADTLTFSAIEARRLAGEMVPMQGSAAGAGKMAIVVREPIGVVGAISPFNFPLNLVAHKLAPAIAAGCPVVLKPASPTPLSALLLAGALQEAGLPDGALAVVIGPGSRVGNAIVDHPDVPLISFTGSPPVGWDIRARQPRKEVALELGNSTPVIVHDDADLDRAAERIAASGFTHAGQSCISVQRIYAHERVFDRFAETLVARVRDLVLGDPLDEETDVGPVIDAGSKERILDWIAQARDAGATVLTGGGEVDGLIEPTVVEGITPEMHLVCEEVFGPVVGLARYSSIDEAIDLSNGTPYGLQAGIFTGRADRAIAWARRLHFGGVLINETPTFRVDQQPYGGVKDSGNTREGPAYAVETMTEAKMIALQIPEDR